MIYTLLSVNLHIRLLIHLLFKFHGDLPLPQDKVQTLSMPLKPFTVHSHLLLLLLSVFKTLFPKHLIFLSHDVFVYYCLCLKCSPNFSSLVLLIFPLPQAQLKCQILNEAIKLFSSGKIKCYLILLLFGLGCI